MDHVVWFSDAFEGRLAGVAVAVSVLLLAFTLGPIFSLPLFWATNQVTGFARGLLSLVTMAVCFVVMASVGYIYLHITERGVAYLDVRWPTRRTVTFLGLGMAFSAVLTIG